MMKIAKFLATPALKIDIVLAQDNLLQLYVGSAIN